ncbi:MAG TPA: phosphoribosyltransferase family protein [Chitinophagales bacterium]|nr:phosphoribosyltransferase family protein [Chitinophagales bacterium]
MITLHNLQFEPFIDQAEIKSRIAEMGHSLSNKYIGKEPVFVIVMKGAFMFAADLLQQFHGNCTLHFTKVQSYVGTKAGEITQFSGLPDGLEGKDVVIVEDIIDSGNTVAFLLEQLKHVPLNSLFTIALLQKDIPRNTFQSADLIGFIIPDKFVVGYGLDYNELGRNLPAIYQAIT